MKRGQSMESNTNPLLAKIKLPGRTFELPSRGALYTNGELAEVGGEIHVHPLSALSEISIKNPDLLFNGKAINDVLKECIPSIKKPTELYSRDIDAIMYFLRLVTYGPSFELTVKHNCEEAKDHSYVVDLETIIQGMKMLDPTTLETLHTITLPNAQVVKIQPVKFKDMVTLFQMNANKKEFTEDDVKKNIIFNLSIVISSVDGITDRKQIEEWVALLTTPYQNLITDTIDKTNAWGPERIVKLTCKDCKQEMPVELPINPIAFFTE